jgi:metallophosphoesterase superfamily enzyme
MEHTLVLGHLHPALSIHDAAGAGRKVPVFLVGSRCIVLPAFSPFARGYDIRDGLPEELQERFGSAPVNVFASTGKRVVSIGPLTTALRAMAETDTTSAAQFRRGRRS